MKLDAPCTLLGALNGLRISPGAPSLLRPTTLLSQTSRPSASTRQSSPRAPFPTSHAARRAFSATATRPGTWLEPNIERSTRMFKGRPRMRTGGSSKGTTVAHGDYGLRMTDHDRRISARQLKLAEETIKQRLRGQRYRLYKRVTCNVSVCTSGNDLRMGKGKGMFDHWATRVAINQIVFELKGTIHEQVIRDAFRLAGNKLPGMWEIAKKGDPPVVGLTKLQGITLEELKKPWKRPVNAASLAPPADVSTTTSAAAASAPGP